MPQKKMVQELQSEIEALRQELQLKESALRLLKTKIRDEICIQHLSTYEVRRYSRQLILPQIGVEGQIQLRQSKILIVGIGGLGCPAAQYLAGAGVGTIGLVDYDLVEVHNLHRQLLHNESKIGLPKTESAAQVLEGLNPNVHIIQYQLQLNSDNALNIIREYDIILDATDNVASRYLLNDACVMLGRPLVSGSALKFEGQLTVYNSGGGPCYRCIFPVPPLPETVTNCGDGGVVGAVVGCIGTLQALEAIKIILQMPEILSGRLLLFDGREAAFRTVQLRQKRPACDVCSDKPIITRLIDYEEFCNMPATDKDQKLEILESHERISVDEYNKVLETKRPHVLVDVRSSGQYSICHIPDSINIPLNDVLDEKKKDSVLSKIGDKQLYVICRRGNDSQLAIKRFQDYLRDKQEPKDIAGGLHEWATKIDKDFPIY